MKVAIIDYQLSNLFSVKHAFDYLKVDSQITSDKLSILQADAAIIPGVGAFGDAMKNLKKFDLIDVIKKHIKEGKLFMGVCLGMQLLFSESEEFGNHVGLDLIKGKVKKFSFKEQSTSGRKVPQIGWNQIFSANDKLWKHSPLKDVKSGEYMYFVHSYYVVPEDESVILAETDYEGIKYSSSIIYKNIFATQFHPEKSGKEGIKIYRDWLKL